jgi:3-hydroxyisobutyrate dehydrogenase
MKRIGYIGLGIMGAPMSMNLMKAGFEVTVWNRTRSKGEAVLAAGAAWADSPADVAAGCEAVCINVTDTPDVEQIIFGPGGIVEGKSSDAAGLVVIDNSTISPAATRDFAQRLAEEGIDMLDAPVSGGDIGAQQGTLAIMVGGKADVFHRCLPIFEAMGKAITHVGDHGAGQATKACNQILGALNLQAVCEAMALARAEGLDLDKMLQVTTAGAGGSWALANLGPRVAVGDLDPGFMVDLIIKDLNIVSDAARRHSLPLPGTDVAASLFRAAASNGHGRDGTQAISTVYEQVGNFKYVGD